MNGERAPIQKPDILAVLENEGVILHKAGRTYRAKCPFHSGKSSGPFTVYTDSQTFHCFGCGEHGDVFDFLMKYRDVSFKEALQILGIRPGKPVPVDPVKVRERELKRAFETWRRGYYDELCKEYRELHALKIGFREKKTKYETTAWILAELLSRLPLVEHRLDILFSGDDEEKFDLFMGVTEGVGF